MTKDLNRGIMNVSYNVLNLPEQIDILSPIAEARNEYLYSNRMTISSTNEEIQRLQYYPFGMAFADGGTVNSQPYKYNSKECLMKISGIGNRDYLDQYDFKIYGYWLVRVSVNK